MTKSLPSSGSAFTNYFKNEIAPFVIPKCEVINSVNGEMTIVCENTEEKLNAMNKLPELLNFIEAKKVNITSTDRPDKVSRFPVQMLRDHIETFPEKGSTTKQGEGIIFFVN